MKVLPLAICLALATGLFLLLLPVPKRTFLPPASLEYTQRSVKDTGAINIVNAVLFDYRGFDSLGEATVIFAAATAFKLLFDPRPIKLFRYGLSPMVKTGIGIFAPFMFIFAIYVTLAGHISPGGAFQGGVILATLSILLAVVYGLRFQMRRTAATPRAATILESLGALGIISIGLMALPLGYSFLTNLPVFQGGLPGTFWSAGSLPLLNITAAVKVGAGFYLIFQAMAGGE